MRCNCAFPAARRVLREFTDMLLDFDRLGPLRWALLSVGVAVSLFLLLPVLFIVALSFGDSQWLMFPPPGWTWRWYAMLFTDPGWLDSLMTSVELGVVVMVLSVVLGLFASLALTRGNFRGRALLKAFFLTPMVLPVVVLAVALYGFFLRIGLTGTLVGFVIGHLIIALPFSIIAISHSLESFDTALEDAALICGASPFEVKCASRSPPFVSACSPPRSSRSSRPGMKWWCRFSWKVRPCKRCPCASGARCGRTSRL